MNRWIKVTLGLLAAAALMMGLTSCSEDRTIAVPQAFCGFTMGAGGRDNNNNANDADLGQVLYQGQSASYKSDQDVAKFFPCINRNYVGSPEGISGDTHFPLTGRTSDGVPISAWFTVWWQPNQSPEPIRDFIAFCQGKYGCAADDPNVFNGTAANGSNNSSPGWNKMLAENMYPVLQRIFDAASRTVGNDVWAKQDIELREQISNEMSDRFAEEFQKTTGSVNDIICGSGSTGTGQTFDCQQVRIVIDGVWANQGNMQSDAAAAAEADAKRVLDQAQLQADLNLTNAKYGPLAPAYRACRDLNEDAPGSCKFITGPGGVEIQVP